MISIACLWDHFFFLSLSLSLMILPPTAHKIMSTIFKFHTDIKWFCILKCLSHYKVVVGGVNTPCFLWPIWHYMDEQWRYNAYKLHCNVSIMAMKMWDTWDFKWPSTMCSSTCSFFIYTFVPFQQVTPLVSPKFGWLQKFILYVLLEFFC